MAKKKKKREHGTLHAAQAIQEAFKNIDGLDPINLMKGRPVEDVLSTGMLMLDLVLGGGIQRGRIFTIIGSEGMGKSTMLQEIAVSAQHSDIPVAYYDPETGADPVFMRRQGVLFDKMMRIGKSRYASFSYTQPDSGEQVYRHIMQTLNRMPVVDSGPPTVAFFIDSFAAMTSENVDEETGDGAGITPEPRMHSHFLKPIRNQLRKKGGVIIGVNQLRTQIGSYGAPEQETGGKALRYYPDYKVRVSRRKDDKIKKDKGVDSMGVQVIPITARTTKNKSFPSWLTADVQIIPGRGVDRAYDAQSFLQAVGLMTTHGGRRRIALKGLDNKAWDLPSFRKLANRAKFREKIFKLVRTEKCYERYFDTMGYRTYDFDADYEDDDE